MGAKCIQNALLLRITHGIIKMSNGSDGTLSLENGHEITKHLNNDDAKATKPALGWLHRQGAVHALRLSKLGCTPPSEVLILTGNTLQRRTFYVFLG